MFQTPYGEMKVCDDDIPPISITVNGEPITEVTSFKYLGARFNSKALCDEEIKTRLQLWLENEWGSWIPYGGAGL